MNKSVYALIAILALASAGCKKTPQTEASHETPKAEAAQATVQGQAPPPHPTSPSNAVMLGGDPNYARTSQEIPFNFGKSGTVTQAMHAGGYTYLEVIDKKGTRMWIAVPETKVSVDDAIVFPEVAPLINYKSRTLNRHFERISFVPGIKIVKT